ncbi:hypothetical protein SAY87_004320 [Trapa incisa]|uniref:Uncharacterized protein n=1 Tax=Trapa incisa TaxID=236973 RepID=A0AAN7JPR9_9MYRT|nr:hypothetical protein SAY87_004320 [Trapa incisa]
MEFHGGAGQDHPDGDDGRSGSSHSHGQKRKQHQRFTPEQIQMLEEIYKEYSHPDDNQRQQLSRHLGLSPTQIKHWFQNKRTQMKATERAHNFSLRAENDRIRAENIAMVEALKSRVCPSCGSQPSPELAALNKQRLRLDNAQLSEQLKGLSDIVNRRRSIMQLPPLAPVQASSLDLSMCNSREPNMVGGSALNEDLNIHQIAGLPSPALVFSDTEKSHMREAAANAMEELLKLVRTGEPLWTRSSRDGRDVLDNGCYNQMFPRTNTTLKNPNVWAESSRDSRHVIMNACSLVDMFMDPGKWMDLFPTIVAEAKTIGVISYPVIIGQNASLLLMYEEILSPVLPTREYFFLRYSQQIEQGLWAVVDVSYDLSGHNQLGNQSQSRRLPSGCLMQDLPHGYTKVVTWVEHVEVEQKARVQRLCRDFAFTGLAFGAERWLATLERMCQRMVTGNVVRGLGVVPSEQGKKSMMKLSERMVKKLCVCLGASSHMQQWTPPSRADDIGVRIARRRSTGIGEPKGIILCAATTIWLLISPQNLFGFFMDGRNRPLWDVNSNGNFMQEVAHITNGSHPGNCTTVLQASNANESNMLILQESCIDSSGSLIVYSPVDIPAVNLAISGEDTSYISLLPSGFAICPDGNSGLPDAWWPSSSSSQAYSGGGSFLTVIFQVLMSSLPTSDLSLDALLYQLISTNVQQIKAALDHPAS